MYACAQSSHGDYQQQSEYESCACVARMCVEAHDANDGCVRPAHAQNCNLREFLQNAIIRTRVARVSLNNPAGHCDMIPPAHA